MPIPRKKTEWKDPKGYCGYLGTILFLYVLVCILIKIIFHVYFEMFTEKNMFIEIIQIEKIQKRNKITKNSIIHKYAVKL